LRNNLESKRDNQANQDQILPGNIKKKNLTGGSTFGFVPAMKSQLLPYYVNGRSSMKECELMRLSDGTRNHFGYANF
jgi:hypothetical protein